jgi:phospholipid/cholesterol/gamma-HCH transport system substrate-binding protein
MNKYRGAQLIRAGFIGTVLLILIIAVGLAPERISAWATAIRYQAQFIEAGGLSVGNDVVVSGIRIGRVNGVALDEDTGDALVTFTVPGSVVLGSQTTAHIRTGTLLGERILELESAGDGTMKPADVIPNTRTSSPYSLNDAVGELTTNVAATDTDSLNQALNTLSETIDQFAPQLGPTFDGVTRVSQALNQRNGSLRDLLASTADVSTLLSERSQRVNSLLLNGNDLLGELVARRQAIMSLLVNTSAVARELSGLVADNEAQLAPALEKLNSVNAMLERNRDALGKAIPGLTKYTITQGEAVSSGFYYNAFVANLMPTQLLQPFLDYAFGFRRGVNAGQPPDTAGPRSELAFPHNGIPGGSR